MRRLKVLELNIESRDYDFLGMTGEIEAWCGKNQIAPKLKNRLQLTFEEAAQLLVSKLENPRIQAVCEYSETTEDAEWTLRYAGPSLDVTRSEGGLAFTVLKGMTEDMEYSWQGEEELPNCLHVRVRRD